MNADETVKPESNKIRSNYAGLSLSADSRFGSSVANLGDLDGDRINELAVGAPGDGGGGAIYILYLDDRGELTQFLLRLMVQIQISIYLMVTGSAYQ